MTYYTHRTLTTTPEERQPGASAAPRHMTTARFNGIDHGILARHLLTTGAEPRRPHDQSRCACNLSRSPWR